MNKEKMWEKWNPFENQFNTPCTVISVTDKKKEFMKDLRSLIKKHQQPFIDALENVTYDVAQKIESEVQDAKAIAKRLG